MGEGGGQEEGKVCGVIGVMITVAQHRGLQGRRMLPEVQLRVLQVRGAGLEGVARGSGGGGVGIGLLTAVLLSHALKGLR